MPSQSAPIRMAYVGCGFLAQKVHLPNIVVLPDFDLMAVAEVRPELGRRVQERFGIPRLYDHHLALADDPEIEAVAVSGHYCGQGEIAIDLLRAGKDVFLEKPMAVSVAQADRILEAEAESGRRLMIGYMKRYDDGNLVLKSLLDDPEVRAKLGSMFYVRLHEFAGDWLGGLDTAFETTDEPLPAPPECMFPSWLPESSQEGYLNYMQEYTHLVNLVRWLLDAGDDLQVTSVDLDDDGYTGVAVLRVSGVRTVLESGAHGYSVWDEFTQIYFDNGWIRTLVPPLLSRNVPVRVEIYYSGRPRGTVETITPADPGWSYRAELEHFAECLRSGRPFRSPASDTRADVSALEGIYRHHVESRRDSVVGSAS
jgi:predicted dehydrogenase